MGEPDLEKGSLTKGDEEYLIDDSKVKKEQRAQSSHPTSASPPESRRPPASNAVQVLTKERKKQKPTEFREDARIWQLYLEEAEEKANDKAELWNTGLDSLLIFAGLFAGVVSSFVIDARRDLQSDSEPRLLTGILDVLRSGSIGDIFTIPTAAYWVSGLWIVSLFTTIFSAIMGVLAKAWLAKYVPATTRREAKDAYLRYKLDRQSERWHLKEVLILVPLLVQIASVLFLAGLVVQLYGDSVTIGQALLCFCILGGVVYICMTVFPLIVPSSPFNTPLSEMFEALFGQNQEAEDRSAYKTDINEGLGEILYTKLIQSPKPTHVDEAIAEVALPTFAPKWTKFLCRNETPRVLLVRFRQCATFRTNDTVQREETLCNHLLALLSFAEHYEEQLQTLGDGTDIQSYKTLDKVLRESLEPGNPLHRWNELPESLRPLLFALRTNVLVLLRSSPTETPQERETPSDVNSNELTDRPWEMSFQEIRSTHRIHFTVAACRGLVAGERQLKTISSFILCLSLAKSAFTASETGRTSEWASSLTKEEREEVNALAVRYVSKLYQATVDAWERMAADALKDLLSVEVPLGDTETARSHAGVLRSLIFSLSQQNHALRIHAIRMLKHVSSPSTSPVLFSGLITASVKSIAGMAVYDDQDVREDGLDLLTELSKAGDTMSQDVRTALVNSVHSGLSKYEDQPRIATVQFIDKISAQGLQSQFVSVINDAIPRLTEVSLDESSSERVRSVAMKLLQRLWNYGFFDIKHAILRYYDKLLDTNEFSSRYNFLNALQQLAKAKDFPQGNERLPSTFLWLTPSEFALDAIKEMFGRLVKVAIYDEDSTIYTEAQTVLTFVARDDRFGDLRLDVLHWLESATVHPSRWRTRLNAVLVVQTFAKRLSVTEELLEKLLKLAMRDDDDDVRAASLKLVSTFLQDDSTMDTFAARVKDTVVADSPESIISFESYGYITDRWVPFLIKIAKIVPFPESIPFLVQRAMAADHGSDTKKAIMGYLNSEQFAEDSASHDALKTAIPKDLLAHVVLSDLQDVLPKRRWVQLLADLLPIDCLNGLATDALSPVKDAVKATLLSQTEAAVDNGDNSAETTAEESEDVHYLSESAVPASLRRMIYQAGWYERMHWAAILAILTAIYPGEFIQAPDIVLAIAVYDNDSDVRHGTLQLLHSLVNSDATRQSILNGVLDNLDKLAQDGDWNVRFTLAQVLAAFVRSNECELPKEGTDKLAAMAIEDRDYDVRSESVNSLAAIVANEERYPDASRLALATFEAGIKDLHWKPRQSWVNFIAPHLKDAESPHVKKVFDVAIADEDLDVRNTALEVLERLLKDKDSKLRDSMASQLGKSVATALKSPELHASTMAALTKLTLPASKTNDGQPADEKPPGHETWAQIIILLGRNEFQGVPKLIELAFKEDSADNFSQLVKMFEKAKLQDPIQTVLPRFLESALKMDANTSNDVRTGAVKLLSRLTSAESYETDYGKLLGDTNDAPIVSRLADIALKDVDDELRKSVLKLLKTMFTETSRFPDLVKSSLSKAVESCFRDPELMKYRLNALTVLHSLTEPNTINDGERFKDIVSPSISHLLKMTLLVTDKEHEYMRKQAEDILLENLTAYPVETKLNRDVLSAIPAMIPTVTVEGRRIVLQLAENLQLSDDTAASIAHALGPLLRTTSSFARATAVELLSRLYSSHRTSNPRLIESAIPEIITLALDEKDDVGEIRTTAIQLLVAISAAPKATNDENSTTASSMNSPVVKQITPLATRFMGLLLNENLRPSVVELLSLMATEATVRRTISLQIMSLAFGTDNISLQGYTQLLARLISDGRFGDEPTDKVMLFVASAMVTRPKLAPYRFEILTALWCRYASKSISPVPQDAADKVIKTNDLVDWFTFALFGRHATVPEVRTWLKRCKAWLPDEPEPEPEHHHIEHEHDGESVAKEETVKSSKQSSVSPEPEHEEAAPDQRSVHSSVVESPQQEQMDHPEEPPVNEGSVSSKRSSAVPAPEPEHIESAQTDGVGSPSSKRSSVASNAVHEERVREPQVRDMSAPMPEPEGGVVQAEGEAAIGESPQTRPPYDSSPQPPV